MVTIPLPPDIFLETASIKYLPLSREAIERLGISAVINTLSPIREGQKVSDAQCIVALILNILDSEQRAPLYRVEEWLAAHDPELLLGPGAQPWLFNDDRLSAALDTVGKLGCDAIMGRIVHHWLYSPYSPTFFSTHLDTTSLLLYGAYTDAGPTNAGPVGDIPTDNVTSKAPEPAYGYSKAHRPDLKQLIFGMGIQGGTLMPLSASLMDGNTADPVANRSHLQILASRLPDPDKVTIVGDCKLVDSKTLGLLQNLKFHVISLLPDTFALRSELIQQAFEHTDWPLLVERPGPRKSAPLRRWHGTSFFHGMPVLNPKTQEIEPVPYRFLVVHSSELEKTFDGGLARKLQKERESLVTVLARLESQRFSCENDARSALEHLRHKAAWHQWTLEIQKETVALPYPRRGRPSGDQERPTCIQWRVVSTDLTVDEAAVQAARRQASHFILITDHLSKDDWSDARLLEDYRHQYEVENHTGFRWFKSEAGITPLFLKKSDRMAALGLVFVLALMVRNYLQYALRQSLAKRGTQIDGRDRKKTATPTTEAAMAHFQGVGMVLYKHQMGGGVVSRYLTGMEGTAREILSLLKVPMSIFTTPRPVPDCGANILLVPELSGGPSS